MLRDDDLPASEPCRDSASKDRCLWTSMKAGMRSPGLYKVDLMGLSWCSAEQPRTREREGVVVGGEGML